MPEIGTRSRMHLKMLHLFSFSSDINIYRWFRREKHKEKLCVPLKKLKFNVITMLCIIYAYFYYTFMYRMSDVQPSGLGYAKQTNPLPLCK